MTADLQCALETAQALDQKTEPPRCAQVVHGRSVEYRAGDYRVVPGTEGYRVLCAPPSRPEDVNISVPTVWVWVAVLVVLFAHRQRWYRNGT
jgi:hypothetical protein